MRESKQAVRWLGMSTEPAQWSPTPLIPDQQASGVQISLPSTGGILHSFAGSCKKHRAGVSITLATGTYIQVGVWYVAEPTSGPHFAS